MSEELESLKKDLNRELAGLAGRLTLAGARETREVLNCGLELESWLSRAQALGGAWQSETVSRVIAVNAGISAGHSLVNATDRLMRLIIRASEHLNQFAENGEALLSECAANS